MTTTFSRKEMFMARTAPGARAALIVLMILGAGMLPAQDTPDRTKIPELGPPAHLTLPPVQRFALSNRLEVVMMEKHDVPIVQVYVLVRTGSAMDPAQQSGLASLTAAMLDEGAGTRSALELADAVEYLGATLSTGAGQHTSFAALNTPLSKLDPALEILGDVVMKPTFPLEELERLRKERLTTLMQWHDEPRAIASVMLNRSLYGVRHPYGIPPIGDEKTLRSFRPADLQRFHSTWFVPNNATIIVVGDITSASMTTKLERVFGSWTGGTRASVNWPDVLQVENRTVTLVDKPGAAQSELRIARIGVTRMTDDYFPLLVMNTILGGSFTSRLNQNLRETHGYSYGAGSFFDMRPLPGPFVVSTAVQTDVTDKALCEIFKELRGILVSVTDEELDRARNYVALGYPENFQSVGRIANQLGELVTYNLPDDFFNRFIDRVLAVTKADVERVAKKYLDPQKVVVIVVGDRKKIEKGVREMKLGKLEVLTVEDVLGKPPKL
ncbi:MAG: pitrilysin family protein [Bacteroidota bacterium]